MKNSNKTESHSSLTLPPSLLKTYHNLFPTWSDYIKKELIGCDSVLDLGCGNCQNSPLQNMASTYLVGVDAYPPYLEECRRRKLHSEYIKADIRQVEFKERSFDAVVMLNVLEHMSKKDGLQLIDKFSIWAKKKVILTTPNGFLPQDGYDSNVFQEHLSGWSVEDFKRVGFRVYGLYGWKNLRGYRATIKYKPEIFWQMLSDLTQISVYRHAELACRLLAIKKLGE
jgi:SAM-dependent methyltransferase